MHNPYNQHPVSPRLVAILCAVYLLLGLLDHDMWKFEDAVHIGVAWDMAQNASWLSPALAGESWPGAPLFHWLAAALGSLLGGLVGFVNGARLATAVCGGLLLYALGCASATNLALTRHGGFNPAMPVRFDSVAPLLMLGAPGLLIPIHEAQPMIAVLAGHALVYWGLVRLPHRANAGLLLGLGVAVTVFAGDAAALLPLLPLALLILSGPWNSRQALAGWGIGSLIGAASIATYAAWHGLGVFLPEQKAPFSVHHLELLGWFVWPVLPLALWAVWLQRRHLGAPHVLLPALGSVGSVLVFLAFGDPRVLPALPILLPLVMLAASGVGRLRRGAANAFDWFAMMTFSLTAALIWIGAVAQAYGWPPKLHKNIARLIPGFDQDINIAAWVFAGLITVLWLLLIFSSRRSPWRGTNHWACGMLLMWGLFAALCMPWVDHAKSYASVTGGVVAALKKHGGEPGKPTRCIASQGLGDAQRAVLHYQAGIITKRGTAGQACNWLLVQSTPKRGVAPGEGWEKIWEGTRPGDKGERFLLFKR